MLFGWSGLGSLIRDHSHHGRSKERMNPRPEKKLAFLTFYKDLTFYIYTDRFQFNKRFLLAGSSSHVNYGQRGNWKLMEKGHILRCLIVLFSILMSQNLPLTLSSQLALCTIRFGVLKFCTNNKKLCMHSNYKHWV